MQALGNFCKSFLLLVLFLFPPVEKEIHDWQHANDFHCDADVAHLHPFEHTCSICDYVFPALIQPETQALTTHFTEYVQKGSPFLPALFYLSPRYNFSLRGPPSIA